jgi:hypothetical protein
MVNREDYKAMLDKAVTELTEAQNRQAELDAERDELDARIAELKQGIMALGPLCGVPVHLTYSDLLPEFNAFVPVGLKEAIVAVLSMAKAGDYITPVAIRDGLTATGYEIKSKNILPSIHNVLKRLKAADEVEDEDLDGKTGYRLKVLQAPILKGKLHTKAGFSRMREIVDETYGGTESESTTEYPTHVKIGKRPRGLDFGIEELKRKKD